MKTRFQILCKDGLWRYVFCRSGNSSDAKTGSAIITTEAPSRAYVSHGETQHARDLEYFASHANGAQVRYEIPVP
jgi:hypothetical protein